jgi:hypothetical protein
MKLLHTIVDGSTFQGKNGVCVGGGTEFTFRTMHKYKSGKSSRYSDSLRAGWSGVRIPVGAGFSEPIQIGPVSDG